VDCVRVKEVNIIIVRYGLIYYSRVGNTSSTMDRTPRSSLIGTFMC
jgi:hypothetical protein